ncbi:Ankyrin repeat-containing protein [Micromonospora purpureochromogenes]|uniref:Ankyrin repeat-containing protein n=1 Tax=Micromonospora purpureochromogenes TaxID=47872 RepID=A0A1C5AHG3_9ACTN|nr:ankyrin repeat domain-containing protein [Micromonospora purpureochromogenes]SCF44668.1 Ankyrin repeat-containing protein [Micromonospora purpureochromogenes]
MNASDANGWTALHFAAQAQSTPVAAEMLAAGAIVDSLDEHGSTPLWRAVFSHRTEPATLRTLLAAGADPDRGNVHGVSPRALAGRIANTDATNHMPPRPRWAASQGRVFGVPSGRMGLMIATS